LCSQARLRQSEDFKRVCSKRQQRRRRRLAMPPSKEDDLSQELSSCPAGCGRNQITDIVQQNQEASILNFSLVIETVNVKEPVVQSTKHNRFSRQHHNLLCHGCGFLSLESATYLLKSRMCNNIFFLILSIRCDQRISRRSQLQLLFIGGTVVA
jgi:hypothetical protein